MKEPKFVKLASVGNPDYGQDPNRPLYGCEPNRLVEVTSFEEASLECKSFIHKNELGSGSWAGGEILDENKNVIAHVSYNGRVWEGKHWTSDTKEIKI